MGHIKDTDLFDPVEVSKKNMSKTEFIIQIVKIGLGVVGLVFLGILIFR